MAKVCISGHYGYDRVENELMLMSMVGSLRRQDEDTEIVVFSANAAQTEADLDVVAMGRDFETVRKELRSADLLIVGGGHLLKETADLADIKYYLRVIKAAQHFDVPVFLYHQTLEPFANNRTKTMVGKVLQKVRKISVADQASVEVLHEMGIRRGRIHLMADPILALKDVEEAWNVAELASVDKKAPQAAIEAAEAEKAKEAEKVINYDGMDVEIEIRIVEKEEPEVNPDHTIVITDLAETEIAVETLVEEAAAETEEEVKPAKPVINRPENLATIVPSFWKKPGEKFAAFAVAPKTELPALQIAAMADHMVENGYQVVFLPLCCDRDVALAKEIMAMMSQPAYIVDGKISAASFYTAIHTVDFVFSTELSVLMLAALCKKPFTALCCCEKTVEWVDSMGLTPTGNLMDYNEEAFVFNFKAAVADSAAVVAAVEEHLPAMQEKAEWVEGQIALIFDQIARKKARTTKGYAARREVPAKLAVDELPVEDAPVEKVPAAEELPEEKEEIEELMETMADMESEELAETEDQGYVRRSRQRGKSSKADSLVAAKDKAKDIFGGIGGKLKSLSSKVEKPARRRPAKEELPEEEVALDEVTEEKEA